MSLSTLDLSLAQVSLLLGSLDHSGRKGPQQVPWTSLLLSAALATRSGQFAQSFTHLCFEKPQRHRNHSFSGHPIPLPQWPDGGGGRGWFSLYFYYFPYICYYYLHYFPKNTSHYAKEWERVGLSRTHKQRHLLPILHTIFHWKIN